MAIQLLTSQALVKQINHLNQLEVEAVQEQTSGKIPTLAVVVIGENKASRIYLQQKERLAKKIGVCLTSNCFTEDTPEKDILYHIMMLNKNNMIDGILIQFPIPQHYDSAKLLNAVNWEKDVDGFHPGNLSRLLQGDASKVPVFPKAMLKMAEWMGADLHQKRILILAKPGSFATAMEISCRRHSEYVSVAAPSEVPKEIWQWSEVIFSATGIHGSVRTDLCSDNTIIVDGGISTLNGKTVGDVDHSSKTQPGVTLKVSAVPGSVGPITTALALSKVIHLVNKKAGGLNPTQPKPTP